MMKHKIGFFVILLAAIICILQLLKMLFIDRKRSNSGTVSIKQYKKMECKYYIANFLFLVTLLWYWTK